MSESLVAGSNPDRQRVKNRQVVGIADILGDPINLDQIQMPKDTLESLGKPERPTTTIQSETSADLDLPPPSILLVGARFPRITRPPSHHNKFAERTFLFHRIDA